MSRSNRPWAAAAAAVAAGQCSLDAGEEWNHVESADKIYLLEEQELDLDANHYMRRRVSYNNQPHHSRLCQYL